MGIWGLTFHAFGTFGGGCGRKGEGVVTEGGGKVGKSSNLEGALRVVVVEVDLGVVLVVVVVLAVVVVVVVVVVSFLPPPNKLAQKPIFFVVVSGCSVVVGGLIGCC